MNPADNESWQPSLPDEAYVSDDGNWEPDYTPDNVVPLRQGSAPSFGPRMVTAGKTEVTITATQFQYRDPATIPPRDWLYGRHLCRKYASATIAPPAAGKTTLGVVDALAMATGRALILGMNPHKPLRVWLWNGEDPLEELERRVLAAMIRFGISEADIGGRLFLSSGRDVPICIGQQTPNGPTIVMPVLESLIGEIKAREIDVIAIDPFISSHTLSENDNGAMDAVVKAFALVADRTGSAIELVHHSRKLNGEEATIDAVRGASSIVGAVRSARVLNVMSKETAKGFCIPERERRSFVRVDDGKSNMAPPEAARWFRLIGQPLGNGTSDRLEDVVAVAETWTPPDTFDGLTAKDLLKVQHAVHEKALRENEQANRWVGYTIGPLLGIDPYDASGRQRLKNIIKTWVANKALKVELTPDEKFNPRPTIAVGEWATVDE